jgi:uncharacterized repeat protein (TIGR01451 family)
VVVTETYDGSFTFVSASPAPTTGNNIWNVASLAPGAEAVFAITGTVSPGATNGQTLTNTVTAEARAVPMARVVAEEVLEATAPLVTATETTTVSTAGPAPAALTVTKTDSVDPVFPGDPLSYTIRIENTGGTTATGIVLTETYASLFTFGSSTPAATTGNNIWNLDDIAPGGEAVITVNGTVNPGAVNGNVLTNSVQATSTNASTVDAAEDTTVDTATAPATTLVVTKTDTVDPVAPGGNLGYTVTVQNTGANTAFNVTLTETYDALFVFGTANPTASVGNNVWSLGNIASGSQVVVNISGTANASATNGATLTNAVSADGDNTSPANANETTTVTVTDPPVLQISKTDTWSFGTTFFSDPVAPSGPIGYQITVQNMGGSTAQGVMVTETYDSDFTFASGVPGPTSGNNVFSLPDLAPGATATIEIIGTVSGSASNGDTLVNNVSATAANAATVQTSENTAVGTAPGPHLTITKSFDVGSAGAQCPDGFGGTVKCVIPGLSISSATAFGFYDITVTNAGGGTATGVTVTETYDANFTPTAADPTASSGNNVWNLGALAAGASATIKIGGTVSEVAPVGGTLFNQVSADVSGGGQLVTATESQTIQAAAAPDFTLNVAKSVSPGGTVAPSATLTYTVTVTVVYSPEEELVGVEGDAASAENVVVTETYPPDFVFLSAVPPPSTGNNVWNLGSLGAGTQTITISGTVSPGAAAGATLNNQVRVTATNAPFDDASASNTVSGAPAPAPVLEIVKSDDVDPRQPGDALVYRVDVRNVGNTTATNVKVTEVYDSFTPTSATLTLNAGPVLIMAGPGNVFTIGSLAAGADGTLFITGTVDGGATGSITNNVSAVADNHGMVATTETTTIGAAPPTAPVLEVTKTDTPDPVQPGAALSYQVIVKNTGTATATGIVVTETYPTEFAFGSATPAPTTGDNVWTLADLAPGDQTVIDIVGTVSNMATNGATLTNGVGVASTNATDVSTSENTTVSTATTQLQITKADSVDPIAPGATQIYSVRVENTGTQTATNVVVTETYPALFTPASATLDGAPIMAGPGNTFALGSIAPGAANAKTLLITGTVDAAAPDAGVLTNSATAAADNAADATTTETTTVTAPVLTVTKSDSADPVMPGDALTYTVTVTNTGTGAAANVVLTETYPAEFTFGSATPAPTTGDNVFALGALAGGASTVVTINGTVDGSTPDATVLSNAVTASADNTPDATTTETTTVDRPTTETTIPTATGTGSVTVTLTGGGSTCAIGTVTTVTDAALPEDPPTGVLFPHGLVKTSYAACDLGSTITVKLTFPATPPLPPGTEFWKFGPRPGIPAAWYVLPATIVGNMVTFQLTDGGLGDDDLTTNGTIVDPGGPGTIPSVPVMPWWVLALLTLALMWSARLVLRRQGSM